MEKEQNIVSLEPHAVKDLYQGVRGLAIKILNRIDRTDAYLERLLDNEMKSAELKGQDKALLYEIVHGVVRWQGRLDWILNGFYKGTFSKAIPNLKNALRVALYQVMFLDRVPDYAAVNEVVEFVKRLQGQKPADLVNAVLRNIIRSKNAIRYPEPEEDLTGYLAAYYSHPSWLVKRYVQKFGREETEKLLFTNNEKPFLTLRINALKTKPDDFKQLLESVHLNYRQGVYLPEFFKLQNLTNITAWEYYSKGFFNIQDESAGLACRLLDVQEGFRILDMCAAPGGKTAYIAALIHSRGEVVAIDRFESRLKLLQKNMERLEVDCVRTVALDALEYHSLPFDRILVDVPCSGTGTLSKKPDIKWRRDIFDIRDLNKIQLNLLSKAATLVKKDGVIVYSTCSIEPEENFEIVKEFLSKENNFKLESAKGIFPDEIVDENGCIQTLPQKHKMDGAFSAKLVRVS
jgi:16S rRNA (cytosine967-C5)-methyltransferase